MLGAPENSPLAQLPWMQPRGHLDFWTVAGSRPVHPPVSLSPSLQSCSPSPQPQSVLLVGIAPALMQDPPVGLVEVHQVPIGLLLQAVRIPGDGIPSLQGISCAPQLGAILGHAEAVPSPTSGTDGMT